MSALEEKLLLQIRGAGLPEPEREKRLYLPGYRYPRRLDFVWGDRWLIVEVQGGTWVNGGHNRGKQYELDCEKANEATLQGFRVLHVTTGMVSDGRALRAIERALKGEGA
jgi:very-short-patch-repair endonuclease